MPSAGKASSHVTHYANLQHATPALYSYYYYTTTRSTPCLRFYLCYNFQPLCDRTLNIIYALHTLVYVIGDHKCDSPRQR